MPRLGTILRSAFDTYTVEGDLGGGGAGVVCAVRDSSQIALAAKVLRSDSDRTKLKRFKNEMMFLLKEDHPNLVKVLDFGVGEEGEPFYIMPLASGTLRFLMRQGIPIDDRLRMFSQILDGVEAAHLKGVIHRDLKPENILYYGRTQQLKVADFGIAHFEEDLLHTTVETRPTDRMANWEYAAPEQRRTGQSISFPADIYALGLMLTELFTGSVPHGLEGARIADAAPSYAYLDEIAERMRRHSAKDRPAMVADVKQELIARQVDYVERQKLDALRAIVVKESETTDPLILNPPKLVNVIFTGDTLEFELSQAVNAAWISSFNNMGSYASLMGHGPEYFKFRHNIGRVPARESAAQQVVNYFKQYLETTNRQYAQHVGSAERQRIAEQRNKLASSIRAEEERRRVQQQLKW